MNLDSLDSYTETVVTQEMPDGRILEWQVVPITPADGARAGVGLGAVQAAVLKASNRGKALGETEADAPVKDISMQDLADISEYTDRLCICGVRGVRDRGDQTWQAVRLAVESNPKARPRRVKVAILHQGQTPDGGSVAQAVSAAAASAMKEAAKRAGTFRGGE